jgi:peroxiredoxin
MSTGNTSEADKAKIDYQAMIDNNKVYTKNFVNEHSNSVVSAFVLLQYATQLDESELADLVGKFAPAIDKTEYVVQLKSLVQEQQKTAIGVVAPDFTMNDTEGKPIQLSSLRGKVVLVDFWAAWCGPCRQENPNVVKLYQQYHSKGFEILGVSLDRTKEDWLKAIKADNLTWIHVSDLQYWQNAAARLYGVNAIPQSFLLDKDGKIIAKGLRGEQLAKKLLELFPN